MFFHNKDSSSAIHSYKKSTGRPVLVSSDFESKPMENVFLSCEREFLSKEFEIRVTKFKANVTSLKKLGIKELISNPDAMILMQIVVINTSEYDS